MEEDTKHTPPQLVHPWRVSINQFHKKELGQNLYKPCANLEYVKQTMVTKKGILVIVFQK